MKYINNNKLLSDRQFGFMEGKSTEDAISSLSAEIYRALDDNKASLCVFLDLAKAFDTVSHAQLLEALEDLGFRGLVLELMTNII